MPPAKNAAEHRAAAVKQLAAAVKHHRKFVTHQESGDDEIAVYHAILAHMYAKRAVKHHSEATKSRVEYQS